jgi:predicted nucleic acid-binding protein
MHLLDTSVLVDVLRKHPPAVAWFQGQAASLRMSVVSLSELYSGVRTRKEEQDLVNLEREIRVLPIDRDIGARAGVFVRLYRGSHGVELPDAIIAATAEHHGLRLATLNVKHFPMFPKLKRAY